MIPNLCTLKRPIMDMLGHTLRYYSYEILKAKLSIFYFIEGEEVQEDFPEVENLLKDNWEGFPQVNEDRKASKCPL